VDGKLEAEWGYDRTLLGTLDYERGGTAGIGGYCRGFEYDSFGKPIRMVTFADGLALVTGNAYDVRFGRVKAVRYPSGRLVALDYTDHGYLKEERNGTVSLGSSWSRRITAMTAHGQVRSESFGNGLAGDYQYDPATGRPTALWVVKPGRPLVSIQSLGYAYDDPQGGLSRQSNVLTSVTETFGYDALSRLDWTTRSWPGGGSETVDYQYDAIGNLVVKGDYSALTSYGSAGRANPANAGPHAIQSYRKRNWLVVSNFRYDLSGNLVVGDGRTAKYDAHDKPVLVEEAGSAVRYAYGPRTERYKRVTAAATTYYVDKLHERIVAGGNVTERDYVGDKVAITRLPSGLEQVGYLHLDRLGSVDTITDRTGAVVERQGFDPFGGPRDEQWRSTPTLGNLVTDRGFTGHEQVDDVHLVHMGGRVYDYRLGRFLSVDPFVVEPRDMQSLNAYSYVRNNPTGRIDPTGYFDRPEWAKRLDGFVTTYFSRSSGRTATGESGKGAAGTPAAGVAALKGAQPGSTAPEDTGGPGKSSFWDSVKTKLTFWLKKDDVKVKGNEDEGAVQIGKNTKLEAKRTSDGQVGVKVGYGPVAVGLQGGDSKLTGEVEVGKKLGDSVEVKAGGGVTLDAKKGGDTEGTMGRVTTFIKLKLGIGNVSGAEGEVKVETGSYDLRVLPSVRNDPNRAAKQAMYDQVEGLSEGAPRFGENYREVHGR
jgi:RHS repeat-associated protein